jgi:N,N'-diacetyllegionaminate synthase
VEKLSVAGRLIGPGELPYVIAEIGSNHNGDMALCRRLIDAAHAGGADAVKFQSWTKSSLISTAEYARNTQYAADGNAPTLEQAVERYQLTPERHREIVAYCRERGVVFLSSCFSRNEVDLLESLDVPAYKIASMDVNHLPLLEYVARTGKPVIISTGMATLGEVERALDVLRANGAGPVALLHCVSAYPCPAELVNLRMLATWEQAFGVPVGYSDHTLGTAVPLAAVALGACILEKHFTLDHSLEGWDHAISADPAELEALVQGSRLVSAALGSGVRKLSPAEIEKRTAFRRRMVVTRAMRRGERLTAADVEFKRPGNGIRPDEMQYVVGRPLARDVIVDEEISWGDLG